MRRLLTILFFIPLLASREKPRQFFAVTYYFAANGSDGNSGTSPLSPWQTISKFNSTAFLPLDSVVFNRGDSWTGTQMIISRSGTAGNPIKIGTYGSGTDPIISGLLTMPTSGWTNLTGNVWQRTVPGGLTSCKVLLFDGAFQPVSQYPRANNQYINITNGTPGNLQTITTTGTITSTGTSGNNTVTIGSVPGGLANVVGMQVVYRPMHWVFWRGVITAVSTGTNTITFQPEPSTSGGNPYSPIYRATQYGFFFQNGPALCTNQGDWAYNGTTLTVNFGVAGPTGHTVQVPTIDNLVSANAMSNVNISGINFRGANSYIFNLNNSSNFTFNSLTVFAGGIGGMIGNNATTNFTSINSTYRNNNSYAMRATASATAWTLTSNFFDHNGAIRGMGGVGEGEYFTVRDVKNGSIVRLNTWNTDGYCSISFQGTNNLIQNNFFNGYCTVKDDGAAIYTGGLTTTGSKIDGNIVINGQGLIQGTPDPDLRCPGIYVDDGGNQVEIMNNTCAMNGDMGINIHNGHELNIHNNTCYDNLSSAIRYYNDGNTIANITLTQNIFFAKTTSELVSRASGGTNSPSTYFATADNNKWCRPLDDPGGFDFSSIVPSFSISTNLAGWRPFIGNKEINSTTCPWTITSTSQLRFEYNATNATANVSLGSNAYVDVNGLAHSGTLTLAPWTSIIMKLTGTVNILPVANAGPDQVITLPTSSVTMAGSATDADGTISSHTLTFISGPVTPTVTTPSSYTTTVTGLTMAGVYVFQLSATDNSGGTSTDNMQVTVNPAPNQPPVANAGLDRVIQLPTNSVTQTGSGTDPDGTIVSYLWTQTSGPSTATITSASQATTSFTNLIAGVYVFNLRVTDNQGATANDQFQVTVNIANQPPTANAGTNQTITLPTNSVTLTGSGTDPDGSIASYAWTKISGPTTFTIVSPTSSTTSVTNLVAGTYVFQLTVTDNQGATGSSTVQVVVNAAPPPNQPPVANAGADKNITLPTNSITQVGSGTDADGSVVAYAWTKISGPTTFTIVSPSSSTTVINNLVAGTYVFQLTVTDNQGATGTDQMTVIVNPAANIPPTVNAGTDQTLTLPTTSSTLTGSATDADGTITSHTWSFVAGPGPTPVIATPANFITGVSGMTVAGTYTFRLSATDNSGATVTDDILILVNPAANQLPIANAGTDKSITLPTNSVTQVGSGTDPDGTIVAYLWTQISGPSTATIVSASQATTVISNLVAGTYVFNLRVTDNSGATANDQATIVVSPAVNQPPIANAGSNQTITLPTNSVTLVGSGSDPDGTITAYLWTKISGPSTFTIVSPTSASTVVNNLVAGTYVFQLQVTDNGGATATNTVQVVVNPAPNQPPTANAGTNQTITLPTNSVTLTGSGTDPDGTITAYLWTKISGPATFTIVSPTSASTAVTNLVAGTYIFQLQVTDNSGATATNSVQITVNAAPPPNQPPIANAGTDKNITLPTNSITQVGSGTDADGTVVSYAWTKISGPATFTIVSPTSATTGINNLVAGTYVFRLTVTDNVGATGTDDMTVIVNPAPNQPPIANAGTDKNITLPTNSVTQVGSGTDADGTIVSYAWTKISGPSTFTIVSPSSSTTVINNLVVGTYVFRLTVTDNVGATAIDDMSIIVNPAPNVPPSVNAGPDQTITLPTSSSTFAGSATDADGTITSVTWSFLSGPGPTPVIANPSSLNSGVSNMTTAGSYTFRLSATDNSAATTTDNMIILVNPQPNQPPVVNAGNDTTFTMPNGSFQITLSGSATDDGTIISYLWTQVSGPTTATIISQTQKTTAVTNMYVAGVYVFRLSASDNFGVTRTDDVTVTIDAQQPPKQIPPTVSAGPNYRAYLCLFCGSIGVNVTAVATAGTYPIQAITWTKISGPAQGFISSPNSLATRMSNLVRGTYTFQITVTDAGGFSATDIMTIDVRKQWLTIWQGKVIIVDAP